MWSQEEYGVRLEEIMYSSGTVNHIVYLANINIY